MDDVSLLGWQPEKSIQVIEDHGLTRVRVRGQPYMRWRSGDEECVRLAILPLDGSAAQCREQVGADSGRQTQSATGNGDAAGNQAGATDLGRGWRRDSYSPAQRVYLDGLEQGAYNAYAGGLLFAPLLARYDFLPALSRVITMATHEGYSLEELGLTLFHLDVFGFRSMEDFKRA